MKKIIADLHLHSKYSRAVSQNMILETMAHWGKVKGVNLLGTADFTHPLWLRELKSKLKEVREGIYSLKNQSTMFVISSEISSIYSQEGKTRRIHNLVLSPSFAAAEKINQELLDRGANLKSDGRPITSLSAIQLAELVFSINQNCLIIPCHVWTPWFSLYGSRSGFDSIEQCFGHFAKKIYAVETGLSSDPAMNWRVSDLDKRQIISFSDAHSPKKIGREATVFGTEKEMPFSYSELVKAIKKDSKANWQIKGTVEFYPEEGKYHYDGHHGCQVKRSAQETKEKGSVCPVCHKPLTLGVEQLADQETVPQEKEIGQVVFQHHPENKQPPYVTLVPLAEIIAGAEGVGVNSKKVEQIYEQMINKFNNEMTILLETPVEKIKSLFPKIGEGIDKVRKRKITIEPGYDGVYGTVKIWGQKKELPQEKQASLF